MLEAPNDGLTTTDCLESAMAKHHYSADSARDPHPLSLTAAGRCMPPDGIAARMASALPPRLALNSITYN